MDACAKRLVTVVIASVIWGGCENRRYEADASFELIEDSWYASLKSLDSNASDYLHQGYCDRLVSMLEKYGSETGSRKDREYFEKYLNDPKWLIRGFRFDGAGLASETTDRITTSEKRLERGWLIKDIYVVWLAELASDDVVMIRYAASNVTKVKIDTLREGTVKRADMDKAMFFSGRCYADFKYLPGSTVVLSYWTPTSSGHRLIKGLEYVIDCPTVNTANSGRKREAISSDLNLLGCVLMPKLLSPE